MANGLYDEERLSKRKYPGYKPRLSRYCPNAQLVIDGKELAPVGYPEKALLDWITSAFNLNKAIGYQSGFFMDKIKEALEALLKKHNFKERVVQLVDNIMTIRDWDIEKRLEVVSKVYQWIDQAPVQGVKSVTLKV